MSVLSVTGIQARAHTTEGGVLFDTDDARRLLAVWMLLEKRSRIEAAFAHLPKWGKGTRAQQVARLHYDRVLADVSQALVLDAPGPLDAALGRLAHIAHMEDF